MFHGNEYALRKLLKADLVSLVTLLKGYHVLNESQVERILHEMKVGEEKVGELLSMLEKRPNEDWEKFCEALRVTNQEHIIKNLWSDSMDSPSSSAGPVTADFEADVPRIDKVEVVPTTKEFYEARKLEAYPMSYSERGIACIINVKKDDSDRQGTDVDRDNLEKLFTGMHFTVKCYNKCDGLSGDEIIQKIKDTAGLRVLDGRQPQCYVLFILSHGDTTPVGEVIYGNDGKSFSREEVLDALNNSNLHGIPRLVCVVTCRGRMQRIYSEEEPDFPDPPDDFIMGLPCEEGHESIRHRKYGTRYVRCFVDLFMKKACDTDVESLLEQMNGKLSEGLTKGVSHHQKAEYRSKLQKKLYLFPGYKE
jgi:hypothetical protein